MDSRKITDPLNRGMVGGLLGMPADMLNMLRNGGRSVGNLANRLAGVNAPPAPMVENPVYGQEWWGNKMQQAGYVTPNRNKLAEFGAGLLDPGSVMTDVPMLAKGLFGLGDPATLSAAGGLFGMIKSPVGRIPETASDANKLADMLQRAGNAKGYSVTREGSAISPSQYITFVNDADPSLTRQVRVSNHIDKYPELASGTRTSVDPDSGVSFEQAVNWLSKNGFPTSLSNKYKDIPSWDEFYKQQGAARSSLEGKLDAAISAWRNQPKATRGEMPTMDEVEKLQKMVDEWRRLPANAKGPMPSIESLRAK